MPFSYLGFALSTFGCFVLPGQEYPQNKNQLCKLGAFDSLGGACQSTLNSQVPQSSTSVCI